MKPSEHYQAIIETGATVIPKFLSNQRVKDLLLRCSCTLYKLDMQHREKFRSTGSMCHFADHPEFADLIAHPDVLELLKQLGATDPRWLSGYLISKPAGGPPLFWHQDWWGWDHEISYQEKPIGLFFMIYLTDTTPENGCLRIIPGSHRYGHELHELPDAHGETLASFSQPDHPAYADHQDQLAVKITAGDLLVGDSRLLHGAFANQKSAERPLLISWYIPNFSSLPETIQARFQQIYRRQELDLDSGSATPSTTEDWPESLRQYLTGVTPNYRGDAEPANWVRQPDTKRMKKR